MKKLLALSLAAILSISAANAAENSNFCPKKSAINEVFGTGMESLTISYEVYNIKKTLETGNRSYYQSILDFYNGVPSMKQANRKQTVENIKFFSEVIAPSINQYKKIATTFNPKTFKIESSSLMGQSEAMEKSFSMNAEIVSVLGDKGIKIGSGVLPILRNTASFFVMLSNFSNDVRAANYSSKNGKNLKDPMEEFLTFWMINTGHKIKSLDNSKNYAEFIQNLAYEFIKDFMVDGKSKDVLMQETIALMLQFKDSKDDENYVNEIFQNMGNIVKSNKVKIIDKETLSVSNRMKEEAMFSKNGFGKTFSITEAEFEKLLIKDPFKAVSMVYFFGIINGMYVEAKEPSGMPYKLRFFDMKDTEFFNTCK